MAKKKETKNYVVSACTMGDLICTSESVKDAYEMEISSNPEAVTEKLYVYEVKLLGVLKTDFSVVEDTPTPQV